MNSRSNPVVMDSGKLKSLSCLCVSVTSLNFILQLWINESNFEFFLNACTRTESYFFDVKPCVITGKFQIGIFSQGSFGGGGISFGLLQDDRSRIPVSIAM